MKRLGETCFKYGCYDDCDHVDFSEHCAHLCTTGYLD